MATKNSTEIENEIHLDDILSANLTQALAISHLLSEQFESPTNRLNDEILSNSVWAIQERLRSAVEAFNNKSRR